MHWMCLHSSIEESQPVCYLSLIRSCQWQGWVVKRNEAHLQSGQQCCQTVHQNIKLTAYGTNCWDSSISEKEKAFVASFRESNECNCRHEEFITIPSFYNPLALNKCSLQVHFEKRTTKKTKTETKNLLCRTTWCLQPSGLPQDIKRTEYQWWRTVCFVLVSQRILLINKDSNL